MPDIVYPTAAELTEIAQDLIPRLSADRLVFDFMPMRDVEDHRLIWEQEDNYTGLQQLRGLNGAPNAVTRIGAKRYDYAPGVYGEYQPIDEEEMTIRRQLGRWGERIDITDLVLRAQNRLLERRLNRVELIGWTLMLTGTFSVAKANGGVVHTDAYPVQTFTAGVAWGTSATATPLANFRAIQLLARGHSVKFDASSRAIMNRVTFNKLVTNTNANDLAGRRVTGLLSPLNMVDINKILLGEGLPQVEVYDEGYLNDAGTFVPFIPDDKVVVVGKRPAGQSIAEYRMTLNINKSPVGGGAYTKVIDSGEREVPRTIEVHDGHNGGPVIYYPSAIVRMNV